MKPAAALHHRGLRNVREILERIKNAGERNKATKQTQKKKKNNLEKIKLGPENPQHPKHHSPHKVESVWNFHLHPKEEEEEEIDFTVQSHKKKKKCPQVQLRLRGLIQDPDSIQSKKSMSSAHRDCSDTECNKERKGMVPKHPKTNHGNTTTTNERICQEEMGLGLNQKEETHSELELLSGQMSQPGLHTDRGDKQGRVFLLHERCPPPDPPRRLERGHGLEGGSVRPTAATNPP